MGRGAAPAGFPRGAWEPANQRSAAERRARWPGRTTPEEGPSPGVPRRRPYRGQALSQPHTRRRSRYGQRGRTTGRLTRSQRCPTRPAAVAASIRAAAKDRRADRVGPSWGGVARRVSKQGRIEICYGRMDKETPMGYKRGRGSVLPLPFPSASGLGTRTLSRLHCECHSWTVPQASSGCTVESVLRCERPNR